MWPNKLFFNLQWEIQVDKTQKKFLKKYLEQIKIFFDKLKWKQRCGWH
jgi:hypothetical protein